MRGLAIPDSRRLRKRAEKADSFATALRSRARPRFRGLPARRHLLLAMPSFSLGGGGGAKVILSGFERADGCATVWDGIDIGGRGTRELGVFLLRPAQQVGK